MFTNKIALQILQISIACDKYYLNNTQMYLLPS